MEEIKNNKEVPLILVGQRTLKYYCYPKTDIAKRLWIDGSNDVPYRDYEEGFEEVAKLLDKYK